MDTGIFNKLHAFLRPTSSANMGANVSKAMTMDTGSIDMLGHLMQSLPQELYDTIYDLTFTFDIGEVIIDSTYRTPSRLRVDRNSRELFAKQYYRDNTFYCHERNTNALVSWLQSLPHVHIAYIQRIHYDISPSPSQLDSWRDVERRAYGDYIKLMELRQYTPPYTIYRRPGDTDRFFVRVRTGPGRDTWSSCPTRDYVSR